MRSYPCLERTLTICWWKRHCLLSLCMVVFVIGDVVCGCCCCLGSDSEVLAYAAEILLLLLLFGLCRVEKARACCSISLIARRAPGIGCTTALVTALEVQAAHYICYCLQHPACHGCSDTVALTCCCLQATCAGTSSPAKSRRWPSRTGTPVST
jgi:hypothetical protein